MDEIALLKFLEDKPILTDTDKNTNKLQQMGLNDWATLVHFANRVTLWKHLGRVNLTNMTHCGALFLGKVCQLGAPELTYTGTIVVPYVKNLSFKNLIQGNIWAIRAEKINLGNPNFQGIIHCLETTDLQMKLTNKNIVVKRFPSITKAKEAFEIFYKMRQKS